MNYFVTNFEVMTSKCNRIGLCVNIRWCESNWIEYNSSIVIIISHINNLIICWFDRYFDIDDETPDGVKWNDVNLNITELDEMIDEL